LRETAIRNHRRHSRGQYRLTIDAILFDEDAELEADLGVYGRVHGLAGTDYQRRDLMLALMWGTPVALAFGLLAAVGTTVTTLIIAATGVWFGGWVDAIIQRLTEVNMILPMLPILVMVGTLYSTSIWLMLGVVIALGIFSAGIKTYRAMLLPIREAPYIEAARAYGGRQWAHHHALHDPAHPAGADTHLCYADPDLRVPGSVAGGPGAGRP